MNQRTRKLIAWVGLVAVSIICLIISIKITTLMNATPGRLAKVSIYQVMSSTIGFSHLTYFMGVICIIKFFNKKTWLEMLTSEVFVHTTKILVLGLPILIILLAIIFPLRLLIISYV